MQAPIDMLLARLADEVRLRGEGFIGPVFYFNSSAEEEVIMRLSEACRGGGIASKIALSSPAALMVEDRMWIIQQTFNENLAEIIAADDDFRAHFWQGGVAGEPLILSDEELREELGSTNFTAVWEEPFSSERLHGFETIETRAAE